MKAYGRKQYRSSTKIGISKRVTVWWEGMITPNKAKERRRNKVRGIKE